MAEVFGIIVNALDLLKMLRSTCRSLRRRKEVAKKFDMVESQVNLIDPLFLEKTRHFTKTAKDAAEGHKGRVMDAWEHIKRPPARNNSSTSGANLKYKLSVMWYGLRKGKDVDGKLEIVQRDLLPAFREAVTPSASKTRHTFIEGQPHVITVSTVGLDRAKKVLDFVKKWQVSSITAASSTPAPLASPKLCIVGIVGQGGLGKSYLLDYIVNQLSTSFQVVAQVELFDNPDTQALKKQQSKLINLLLQGSATYEEPQTLGHGRAQLVKGFEELAMSGKSVCITIDDVWRAQDLEDLLPDRIAMNIPSFSCCIMITSQVQSIVHSLKRHCACSSDWPCLDFQLELLAEEDSRRLLEAHATDDNRASNYISHNDELSELVEGIYPLCHNLPKALKITGEKLAIQRDSSFWEQWKIAMAAGKPGLAAGLESLNNILDRGYKKLDCDSQVGLCGIAACFHGWSRQTAINIVGRLEMDTIQNYSLIPDRPMESVLEMHGLIWKLACSKSHDVIICRDKWSPSLLSDHRVFEQVKYLHLDVRNADEFLTEDDHLIMAGSCFERMKQLRALDMLGPFKCTGLLRFPDSLRFLRFQLNHCIREVFERVEVRSSLQQLEFDKCADVEELLFEWVSKPSHARIVIDGIPTQMPLDNLQPSSSSLLPAQHIPRVAQFTASAKRPISETVTSMSHLRDLPEEGLISLEMLTISVCDEPQQRWSPSVEMAALKEMKLKDCVWTELEPSLFLKTRHLTKLSLKNCHQLIALPQSIGILEFLKELILRTCNNVKELPEAIGKLRSLARLDLEGCRKLARLPSNIKMLESLEELSLNRCDSLERLPHEMDKLKSLKILRLSYCQNPQFIQGLPFSIGTLNDHQLSLLELQGLYSGLNEVPDEIKRVSKNVIVP